VKRCILVLIVIGALFSSACSNQSPTPQGKYFAPIIPEVFETAYFDEDTLELCNPRDGTRVFEYEIVEEGTKIKLTNVETGETRTRPFKYVVKTSKSGEIREVVIIDQLIYYPDEGLIDYPEPD
jgi:hypothetical protein